MNPAHPAEHREPIFTVGLTGGIGSGKSTVAEGFAAHGVCVVDTDAISHALTAAGGAAMPLIVAAFGEVMRTAAGALDRTAMRSQVFGDAAARSRLEGILHPLIRAECLRQLSQTTSPYALLVVPLLLETGVWRSGCDRVLVIDCPPEVQIARVMARNGLAREEVERIMAAQADRATRLACATEVIDNSGTPAALDEPIARLHQHYLRDAAAPQHRS